MNLFIYSLTGTIEGYFFDDKGGNIKEISVPFRSGIIDELSKYDDINHIEKIFVVSGPASFTSLRNIAVFINIFFEFSEQKITLYSVPTTKIFPLLFSNSKKFFLSVGKRETFLFSPAEENNYQKHKNPLLAEKIRAEATSEDIAGFVSPEFKNILPSETIYKQSLLQQDPAKFFLSLLSPEINKNWKKKFLEIEYGAEPNIG